MGFLGRDFSEESDDEFDGSMFGRAERHEKRKTVIERAREIYSGFSSGQFERDEEVLDAVRALRERDG